MASERKVEVLFFLPEEEVHSPRPHERPYVWVPMDCKDLRVNYIYRTKPTEAALRVAATPVKQKGHWHVPSAPYDFVPLL